MKRAARWFLPLAIVLGVMSCSERLPTEPQGWTPPPAPTSETPTDSSLAANRDLWNDAGMCAYRYRFRWECFCGYESIRWVDITVVRGTIVSVVDVETSLPVSPQDAAMYRTIDGLFDFVRESMDYPADHIRVAFAPGLGFPMSGYVDYRTMMADEELGFSIGSLVRMRQP
jgi:hypothetical protein